MGLLDSLLGNVLGGGKQQSNLVNELMVLLNNQQIGGISGLVEKLSKKGLGDVVNSWISTGKNMPVSPQQIQNALGPDTISQIASKLGVNTDKASKQISNMLPQIVDKLTPGGKIPEGDLMAKGMDILKGLMK